MNAVVNAKAGIASGILSMNRMVGGSLGVAVIGAVFQGAASSRLDQLLAGSGLTGAQRDAMAQGLASGQATPPPGTSHAETQHILGAAHDAFVFAFADSMKVATAVSAAGIVIALALISSRQRKRAVEAPAAPPAADLATGEHAAV